jgi:phosphoribosylanthranilate isomerase
VQVSPWTAPPRVKLCGIRSRSDLAVALKAGADALGFIVGARHRTEDELTPAAAAELVALLPPFVDSVMVTHLQHARPIIELIRQVGATTLQLQDGIAPQELQAIRSAQTGVKLIQAIHVGHGDAGVPSIAAAMAAEPLVDALVLDSRTADRIGGTGVPHDWSVSRRIVERIGKPVILAGGLRPENLRAALETVRPAAVDVNSGIEDAAGAKDPVRAEAFVQICRSWGKLPLTP